MANDWIKFRVKLATDGRVRAAARATKQKPATILGGLLIMWALADSHADDEGILGGYTFEDIDEVTGIKGFCASLPADWIGQTETGILLPRYHEHNGTTAKKRAESNARVAEFRRNGNADVTQKVLQNADKTVTESVTREEKRRIEKDLSPPTPPSDYSFEEFESDYPIPACRGRKGDLVQARIAWDALPDDPELRVKIRDSLRKYKACYGWKEHRGAYQPNIEKFLLGRYWEAEPDAEPPKKTKPKSFEKQRADRLVEEAEMLAERVAREEADRGNAA